MDFMSLTVGTLVGAAVGLVLAVGINSVLIQISIN